MAQFLMPCVNPISCPGADVATLNLSSETPEAIRYFGFKFWGDQWGLCITTSPELAALCDLPFPTNPPPLVLASSTPQTCTVPCDGLPVSYTAVAGSFVAATQADADIQAFALACVVAQVICDGGTVTVFTNTAQSCTVPCPTGGSMTITMPIGVASGITQAQANNAALALACVVADFLCNQSPDSQGIPPFGGAGTAIPSFYFGNSPQSCSFTCADGQSIFTHLIAGGLFYGSSPAAANAVAESFACNRGLVTPACLDSIVTDLCENSPYADIIGVTGFTSPSWSISGILPLGLFFSSGGIISGSPVELGHFPVTVRASQGNDYVERTYTFNVRAITTASPLPAATQNTAYSVAFAETGFDPSAVWSVASGSVPSGLILNPNTGVLAGAADTTGAYNFTIAVTEGSASCEKAFSLTVNSSTDMEFWDMEELAGNRLDSVHGAPMVPAVVGGSVNRVAGKVNFAVQLLLAGTSAARLHQTGGTGFPFAIATGMTMCGWVNITTVADGGMGFGFHTGPTTPETSLGVFEDSGTWYLFQAPGDLTPIATPAFGSWQFFILELLTNGTMQLEFNRSTVFESVPVTPPADGTNITLVMEIGDAVQGDWAFDEIGLFPFVLSTAQKNYIWNSGNGRGSPIVLP